MKRKKGKIAATPEEDSANAEAVEASSSKGDSPAVLPDDAGASGEAESPNPSEPPTPEQQIEQLQAERAELQDKLLRAQAECANISKRLSQQHAASLKMAGMTLARALLPVMDGFDRTLGVLDEARENAGGQDGPVAEGVRLIAEEFRKSFREQGVVSLEPVGDAFDPMRHEAMMQDKDTDAPAGTVTQVFQSGYMMHDRVLRPAKVAVAAGSDDAAEAGADVVEEAASSDEL